MLKTMSCFKHFLKLNNMLYKYLAFKKSQIYKKKNKLCIKPHLLKYLEKVNVHMLLTNHCIKKHSP